MGRCGVEEDREEGAGSETERHQDMREDSGAVDQGRERQ